MVKSSRTLDSHRPGLYPALLLRSSVTLATGLRKCWGKKGHSQQRGFPGAVSLRGQWPRCMQNMLVHPTVWLHDKAATCILPVHSGFSNVWHLEWRQAALNLRFLPGNETQTQKSAVQSSAGSVAGKQSQLLRLWSPAPCMAAGGCTESVFSWESGVVMSALRTVETRDDLHQGPHTNKALNRCGLLGANGRQG